MSIVVGFDALNFGISAPGTKTTETSRSAGFSGPVENLTATIAGDTSHVFNVVSVTVYDVVIGHSPHGAETFTLNQVAQSNGVTPLSVAKGQVIAIVVQYVPTASTPDSVSAMVAVNGDGLDPVSIPLSAALGEVSVDVPTVTVEQNKSTTVNVTVTLKAGPTTTVTLAVGPNPATPKTAPPSGFVSLSPTSVQISSGKPGTLKLTVNPGALSGEVSGAITGTYKYALSGTAFNGAYALEAAVNITVEPPGYFIKSKLGGVISIADSSTKPGAGLVTNPKVSPNSLSQLWTFMPDPAGSGYYYIVSKLNGNVIDIAGASTKSGALLDAYPRKVAEDGHSGSDNQLWFFVADPLYPTLSRIVSKLNGNVIDVQGASSASNTPIDASPIKLTNVENQQWDVIDGEFPNVQVTVPYDGGWGNGNVNYVMDGETESFASVSVTVEFSQDFSSSSNGYGFQLNCYSSPDAPVVWQQFAVYANPGDAQLHAIIQTWKRTSPSGFALVTNIDVPFYSLPNPTIPAGYSIDIALTYYEDSVEQPTVIVNGATFKVSDKTGHVVGTETITIPGRTTTSQPAAFANLAPVTSLTFNIVGDYNNGVALLTQGAGKITYKAASNAESGMTVTQLGPPGPVTVFRTFGDTGENANVVYGPLPWPWSTSMTKVGTRFEQLFKVTRAGSNEPWIA